VQATEGIQMGVTTQTPYARVFGLATWVFVSLLTACNARSFPTQPSGIAVPSVTVVSLEAEAGSGDGQVIQRSRASGGQTVHLGPGEHRLWTFDVRAVQAQYALSVSYSNSKEGANEIIHVTVDGTPVSSFQNRDTGEDIDGWNEFVTDPAGTTTLGPGIHILRLDVSGGDGCVEIDVATLSPGGRTRHSALGRSDGGAPHSRAVMHGRQQLAADLRSLGIEPGDIVMAHASVRAVGEVASGPDEIHLALKDALPAGGTLMMYAGCPRYVDEAGRGKSPAEEAEILEELPPFDAETARSARDHGILVEVMKRVALDRNAADGLDAPPVREPAV
jgi:hypothetical protein